MNLKNFIFLFLKYIQFLFFLKILFMELNILRKDYGFEMKKDDTEYHIKTSIIGDNIKIEIEYILGIKK